MKDLPIEISLNYPVESFGEQISKLVIKRRPTTKDLKAMDAETGEIAKTAALVARLCEVPPATIDQMDAADFTRAADVVQGFILIPPNWRDMMGDLAYSFHFSPADLWGMGIDELIFWHKQAQRHYGKSED